MRSVWASVCSHLDSSALTSDCDVDSVGSSLASVPKAVGKGYLYVISGESVCAAVELIAHMDFKASSREQVRSAVGWEPLRLYCAALVPAVHRSSSQRTSKICMKSVQGKLGNVMQQGVLLARAFESDLSTYSRGGGEQSDVRMRWGGWSGPKTAALAPKPLGTTILIVSIRDVHTGQVAS